MKTTKSKLISSLMILTLCVSMFAGSTYAWFTDEVVSAGNIIKSGTLKVGLEWAEGTEDPAATTTTWADASTGAIFDYQLWEPGYVDVKHVKISNLGNLALKYQLQIEMEDGGEVSELAKVIDVYFIDPAQKVASRDALSGATKVGTLDEFISGAAVTAGNGDLGPGASNAVTIALKMQESAGNEYQDKTIGNFAVKLFATQDTVEEDAFDDQYDLGATFGDDTPDASVTPMPKDPGADVTTVSAVPWTNVYATPELLPLDAAYQFKPTESEEEGLASEYADWHADFVVKADKAVAPESISLVGYYKAWCQYISDNWVYLNSTDTIPADTEIRLVGGMGRTVAYWEICKYGNDGIGFCCGAVDEGGNEGTTLTVELRLYETDEALGDLSSTNSETGHYIVVGEFDYTF